MSYCGVLQLLTQRYYIVKSDIVQDCHRGVGSAGAFGNRWICDSPESLTSLTFSWLSTLSNQIHPDFVVWTGDNARHDADPLFVRTEQEIYTENTQVADALAQAFPGVPLVPSVGNNDVYPHDQCCIGPNNGKPNLKTTH